MNDEHFMKHAIRLARRGSGRVSPNPRVGAVVVKGGSIVSTGFHRNFGGPHAEADALAGLEPSKSRGATLYVNLEPCVHHGKTPPCTDAIIRAGIGRVVAGIVDPHPLVSGRGIEKLRKHGILVTTGVCERSCIRLNEGFIKAATRHEPFVTLKIAQTLDGYIASGKGEPGWITGVSSRKRVHEMRRDHDAVLVGIGTVLADDPELTVRIAGGFPVKRMVLDSRLRIPLKSRLLNLPDARNTIIVTTNRASSRRIAEIKASGCQVWPVRSDSGRVHLPSLCRMCVENGIQSILVEGGSRVFSSFLRGGLADRIVCFIAPRIFGRGIPAFETQGMLGIAAAPQFRETAWKRAGCDMMFEGNL